MIYLFIFAGAVIGGILLEAEGIIPGMLGGYLFFRVQQSKDDISALTSKVELLEHQLRAAPPVDAERATTQPPSAVHASEAQPEKTTLAPDTETPAEIDPTPTEKPGASLSREEMDSLFEPAGEPTVAPPVFTTPESEPPGGKLFADDPLSEWVNKAKAFILGGNLFGRLGVAVLFIGLSFLIKEAIQYGLFPIELRLAAAFAIGSVMIFLGWRLTEKRPGYGLTLQGGGIAILYLTVFSGFWLYELFGPEAAFIFLAVIAILGTVIAILQNAQSLAVISLLGGFLAPVITSTGEGNHVALFSYYAVLNAGILFMAWRKPWRALHLTGFVCTFAIATVWGGLSYKSELFSSTEPFLVLFFLMYFGIALMYALRHSLSPKKIVDGTLIFGLPVIAFTLQAVLVDPFEYGLAWSALVLGGFYAGAAWLIHQRKPALMRTLVEALAGISLALLSMTIPFALEATWVGTGWALEGAALVWLGIRQRRLLVRLSGLALMGLAVVFFIEGLEQTSYETFQAYLLALNPQFMGFTAISVATLFAGYQISKHSPHLYDVERYIPVLLLGAGILAWIAGGFEEIRREFFTPNRMHLQVVFVSLSMAGLSMLGRRISWNGLVRASLSLLPMLYFLLMLSQIDLSHAFRTWGALAWIAAIGAMYGVLFASDGLDQSRDTSPRISRIAHAAALWLFTWLMSAEMAWLLDDYFNVNGIWPATALLAVPTLVIFGVSRWAATETWPAGRQRKAYLTLALPAILAGVWLVSIYLSFEDAASPAPLPYIPVLNPLDVMLGFIAAAGVFWYRTTGALQPDFLQPTGRRFLKWGAIATGFVWMNATIARTVHHWGGIPYSNSLLESSAFQSAISICWTLLALSAMIYAARKGSRTPWFVSAALLGIVIVKMFVVDLSHLTTMHRVISFIGVGILLLIVGYMAPVPPKDESPESASPDPGPDPENSVTEALDA